MVMLLAVMLVAADPAAAAQGPQTVAPADAVPAPKKVKEKRICRELGDQTGSRMSRRVCKTEEEWAQQDQGRTMNDLGTMGARTR